MTDYIEKYKLKAVKLSCGSSATCKLSEENVYYGQMNGSTFQGKGMLFKKGTRDKFYEGIFDNGVFKKGRIVETGSQISEGTFDDQERLHGQNCK